MPCTKPPSSPSNTTPQAQRYYQTKRQQGKTHRTALTAAARRLCNITLTILKTQTTYNPKPI